MRVLNVTQVYYPYFDKGGPVAKIKGLCDALAQRGHQVEVVTADQGPRAKELTATANPDVPVTYLRSWLRYRTATVCPGILPFCALHRDRFDIVHIFGLYDSLGAVAGIVCRRRGIPYVVEPLGMYRPIVRSLRKKRLYSWLLGARLISGAHTVIATCEQERQDLLEGGVAGGKIVLRRNGLDLTTFKALPTDGRFRAAHGLHKDQPLVLFLGRISFVKGLDVLVRAFNGLDLKATLVIAGPDDGDGCLETIRKTAGDRVAIIGPLYGPEKLEALVDADVLALSSRNESFGNSAAEAIACGTPVLVTERCGIASFVADRVGLVVSFEEGAVRGGLRRLLVDEGLRSRLRATCPEVAAELSWDEPIEIMESLYARVGAEAGSAQRGGSAGPLIAPPGVRPAGQDPEPELGKR